MAEFSEVMKQLARMANACNGKCDKCPLGNSVICNAPWCFRNTESIAEAERIVMQWAAEHPEPVYPTLIEWLRSIGLADHRMIDPIPADIAEKLGLKPKGQEAQSE